MFWSVSECSVYHFGGLGWNLKNYDFGLFMSHQMTKVLFLLFSQLAEHLVGMLRDASEVYLNAMSILKTHAVEQRGALRVIPRGNHG